MSETGRREQSEPEHTPEPTPDHASQPVSETTPEQEPAAESVVGATAVEPEQGGEEDQGPALDADISELDSTAGGETEEHGEQPETGRRERRTREHAGAHARGFVILESTFHATPGPELFLRTLVAQSCYRFKFRC